MLRTCVLSDLHFNTRPLGSRQRVLPCCSSVVRNKTSGNKLDLRIQTLVKDCLRDVLDVTQHLCACTILQNTNTSSEHDGRPLVSSLASSPNKLTGCLLS